MSPKPKIPVTGELWLNADNMPQLTITLPSGEKLWVQVPRAILRATLAPRRLI